MKNYNELILERLDWLLSVSICYPLGPEGYLMGWDERKKILPAGELNNVHLSAIRRTLMKYF